MEKQETRGEDTREMSLVRSAEAFRAWLTGFIEANVYVPLLGVRNSFDGHFSAALQEAVESSTEAHAELPAFPIEKLKDWLRGKDSWWRSQNLHNTRMGSEFETSDYWDVMRKIAELEAEVKEGK